MLHLFSGSLSRGAYVRLDLRANAGAGVLPDVQADATALPFRAGTFDLILADPPYSGEDANRYGTAMVDRRRVFAQCVHILRPGGHLVWLDMVHPMYRKAALRLWGEIGITRSTNHRYRIATLFERQPT
jgi:SAM-dependent methyltransferase